jgi:hypothetical protein
MQAMSIDVDPFGTPANANPAEVGSQCTNSADEDLDSRVNDGCPTTPATLGAPESGFACNDILIALDNDLDGVANDGCAETSCLDAADNDADGVPNDGCPTYGSATIGSRESCARINENDMLDGDEDTPDSVTLDVTATGLPASNPMIAFAFTLNYDAGSLTVESNDPGYMLASHPRSSLINVSDSTPDDNSDNRWNAAAADTNDPTGESGSGVLNRIIVSSEQMAMPGVRGISLSDAAHIDPTNTSYAPDTLHNANVAVDQACPAP